MCIQHVVECHCKLLILYFQGSAVYNHRELLTWLWPRKYKPLAIVAFFCLLNGPAELGVVAALALGYLREKALLKPWDAMGCHGIANHES